MPNRILREGILTSHRVNRLSERAELFYRRLMSRLDDYGRCEADVELMRSSCYPLRVDKVKATHITAWLEECRVALLLVVYKVGSKCYLQYLDWKQQERSESKFPGPDKQVIADATQMISDAHLVGVVDVVVSEDGVGNGGAKNGARHARVVDETPIVLTLPLRDGGEYEVRQSLVAEFDQAYPAVDVAGTLREMRVWCLSNRDRQKTRVGVPKFINNWLKNEQEKLHGR